jgi:16S rRNA (cytidine1402-2'-O)-methyltransferase
LKPTPATLLLFETGSRLAKSLADMAEVLGAREAALAKELTKLHETVTRGTLDALAEEIGDTALKGEFVVVIAPPASADAEASDEAVAAALQEALADMSFRDAVRTVAERFGLKRARVYEFGLALERKGGGAR